MNTPEQLSPLIPHTRELLSVVSRRTPPQQSPRADELFGMEDTRSGHYVSTHDGEQYVVATHDGKMSAVAIKNALANPYSAPAIDEDDRERLLAEEQTPLAPTVTGALRPLFAGYLGVYRRDDYEHQIIEPLGVVGYELRRGKLGRLVLGSSLPEPDQADNFVDIIRKTKFKNRINQGTRLTSPEHDLYAGFHGRTLRIIEKLATQAGSDDTNESVWHHNRALPGNNATINRLMWHIPKEEHKTSVIPLPNGGGHIIATKVFGPSKGLFNGTLFLTIEHPGEDGEIQAVSYGQHPDDKRLLVELPQSLATYDPKTAQKRIITPIESQTIIEEIAPAARLVHTRVA